MTDDAGGKPTKVTKAASAKDPRWLNAARDELGVTETPGKANTTRVVMYHSTTSLGKADDSVPWCASFVNFALKEAGIAGTGAPNARSFLQWGVSTPPKVGAVGVMRRGNSAWQGHVGFVTAVTPTHVELLGGNQGDKVSIQRFDRSLFIDFRWPKGVKDSKTIAATAAAAGSAITEQASKLPAPAAPPARPPEGFIDTSIQLVQDTASSALAFATSPGVQFMLNTVMIGCLVFIVYERIKKIREHNI